MRRTSVLPQAKPRRRGGSAAPSIEIPKGGAGLRPAESTKKDTTYVVSFFPEGTVKMDILDGRDRCRRTTKPAFWPAARVRRTSVLPQAKPRRRGGSAAPSIEIPKGGAALRAAEPTKKDICKADVLFCVFCCQKRCKLVDVAPQWASKIIRGADGAAQKNSSKCLREFGYQSDHSSI